ncbi:hypothetical protein A9G41_03155 [Gilliamella sp. Nev5-1]|uniref:CoA-transferase n=1 Tax=unclassified Gilliamella TaxID=2685620 RepID=UPI00080EE44A|nr:CoA-transferase [Gilliamella apicola]OCG61147.1 hypothetical protein A9G40_01510 [Gilliamella apicola]OCG71162.1 hypothetical protein A9G41_03155 [Gilliamella apicola]
MKLITADEAAQLLSDRATIIPGGFGSCGHPDALTEAIERRYLNTGSPKNISLLFASGAGDRSDAGLNKWAHKGLVVSAIGGYWGLCPKLVNMAKKGLLEGHNWPQGIISNLYKEVASGSPGILSKVGMNTFVDPRYEGGLISPSGKSMVKIKHFEGEDYLFYPAISVDYALLRGTECDQNGNITMIDEAAYHDALAQAQAVKKCGGTVIVQVKIIVDKVDAQSVKIPGFLVDYVVVSDSDEIHPQTYGHALLQDDNTEKALYKSIIARRALREIPSEKAVINLGIGIPALIGAMLEQRKSNATLTIESGVIGGNPLYNLSFGASCNPQAVIEQSSLFNFYDGGGIDVAFLGFAEIDGSGAVNASKFGETLMGAGGFINIAQSAKKLVLCGALTTKGLEVEIIDDVGLNIVSEGGLRKFVQSVQQITVHCSSTCKDIIIITERAVFRLDDSGLTLFEIAPNISPDSVQQLIAFPIRISENITTMNL